MTRVVFMGTPDFAVPSLAALVQGGYNVVGVLTRQDRPAGRGQALEESAVKRWARAHGLAIQQPDTLRSSAAQAELAALSPDLIVVAAYGLILPQAVLDLPRFGCVNVHGSLLPRHRGAAPIPAAILAGDTQTGISIMLMDAGLDTGPILSAEAIPIAPHDTTGSLTEKLARLGAELLLRTLPGYLAGTIAAVPQRHEAATYAPRISKEAGQIIWTEEAVLIERKVRAYQPWPTAYTTWNGQRLKVIRARAEVGATAREQDELVPGRVVAGKAGTAGVVTGDGILWLEEVQLAGKKPLPIASFLAGARGFVGSSLG